MNRRTLVFGGEHRLSVEGRAILIQDAEGAKSRVPIEDVGVILFEGPGVSLSASLLGRLGGAGVACVFIDDRYLPSMLALPYAGHAEHAKILLGQIGATRPTRSRIWQAIVSAKIEEQAAVLAEFGSRSPKLENLARRVEPADRGYAESQAAALYFPRLFGKGFTRERGEPGVNAALNYGYAVLRASVARAVVGAGLHPALGVQHHGPYNPFNLADDLMEPLRPMVDRRVKLLSQADPGCELTPANKRFLVAIVEESLFWHDRCLPFFTALEYCAADLRSCLLREKRQMRCPRLSRMADSGLCGSS